MVEMHAHKVLMGRKEDGSRIFVDVNLNVNDRLEQTVTHDHVSKSFVFSASGEHYPFGDYEPDCVGQMLDELLLIEEPAKGLTLDDAKELHRLWKRWHLNDMNAACEHHPEGAEIGAVCPVSGYGKGTAWLTEVISEEDLNKMISIIHRLRLH